VTASDTRVSVEWPDGPFGDACRLVTERIGHVGGLGWERITHEAAETLADELDKAGVYFASGHLLADIDPNASVDAYRQALRMLDCREERDARVENVLGPVLLGLSRHMLLGNRTLHWLQTRLLKEEQLFLSLEPNYQVEYYIARAQVQEKRGWRGDAIRCWREAAKRSPVASEDGADLRMRLADLAFTCGRIGECLAALEEIQVSAASPRWRARAHLNAAIYNEKVGVHDVALRHARVATDLEASLTGTERARLHLCRAWVAERTSALDDAEQSALRALNEADDDEGRANAYGYLARGAIARGDVSRAVGVVARWKAEVRGTDRRLLRYHQGLVAVATGPMLKGIVSLLKMIVLDPLGEWRKREALRWMARAWRQRR
jgi:tetratricopeptide (TPR) repeat protein